VTGRLLLEDGTTFRGDSVGAPGLAVGEGVFTTAMTGYQEVVTDPSYAAQVICFAPPMVGNYGVGPDHCESEDVHCAGIVMREAGGGDWVSWLGDRGVPALTGVDTRSVVLHLRERGAMRAAVVADARSLAAAREALLAEPPMTGRALVHGVSRREPYVAAADGRARIALVDYGCKRSIVRRLVAGGAAVTVYPHDVDADELARFDGVVLSNGPGDPEPLHDEIAVVRELLGRVPLLGICLGHQLLALAAGHRTFKLRFGHRGANHPVLERCSGRVLVTSQNHGFAVAPTEAREATYVSLYDGTVEGLSFPRLRARSVQFHPEAGPGPHDAWPVLDRWLADLETVAAAA
jgi:carbamoyl-phosphate synthase small subunit